MWRAQKDLQELEGHQERVCLDQRFVKLNTQCTIFCYTCYLHLIWIKCYVYYQPCFRENKDYQEKLAAQEREELENLDQRFHYVDVSFYLVHVIKLIKQTQMKQLEMHTQCIPRLTIMMLELVLMDQCEMEM